MSQLSRCDVQLKTTPLWNTPQSAAAQYFLYIRTEPKADGSFIDPVSQFITNVYPHLKNRHQIVLMPLSDQPVVPAALTEVPSVLYRKDAATPPTHLHSKESLIHWLHSNLCDHADARTAWLNAHQRLGHHFRATAKEQHKRHAAYRKPHHKDDDDCSSDDSGSSDEEDDCTSDEEDEEDCEDDSSSSDEEEDCDNKHNKHQPKFFNHHEYQNAPRHTCGK